MANSAQGDPYPGRSVPRAIPACEPSCKLSWTSSGLRWALLFIPTSRMRNGD